ncbi:MAG: hypothetical protein ACRECX_14905 [Methyloceanibacter sp.]|uniref:hypothetical protein n=1 Tax=Methyloceanibacter sp. TaxID=1965321 RepID=UPI003D6D8BAC
MVRVTMAAVIAAALAGGTAYAAETAGGEAQAPACRKAEINPVTGFVFCIDPLGAAVEKPPEDIAPPCNDADSRGQWSWGPNCRQVPQG